MMLRLLAFVMAIAWLLPASQASAQRFDPMFTRSYPERMSSGCVWVTVVWSDGSFESTLWECGSGIDDYEYLTLNGEYVRARGGYPQIAGNGCTEYVTKWEGGPYTWIPASCPAGVAYLKSQSGGIVFNAAPSAPPVNPPPGVPGVPPATRNTCPAGYPIKGNANSGIYHVPGQQYYNATNPERCFATEADARAGGYRRSLV